jgi:uncharacterized protein (DUF2062 family)
MKDRLRKLIPSRNKLREFSALRPVAHLLNHPELWHLNRRGVSGAAFVGLFSAFIPVPSQMLLAAIIAMYVRVNLPISVTLVWITNPITIPPMIYGSYRVGAWVLGIDVAELQVELSLEWVLANFVAIGKPLFVGSVICGLVAGSIGFTASHFLWRNRVMRQWRKRRRLRAEEPR